MRRTLNDVDYNLHLAGAGETAVVLLHYFGGSGATWQPVSDLLAARARVVAPDLRGFGATAAPAAGYTVDDYTADVLALLDTLDAERIVLAGHSMGGKIALSVAARRPARLAALVLVAPSPPTPEPMADADRQRLLQSYGDLAAARKQIETITAKPLPAELVARTAADNVHSARAAWDAWLQHGSRENIADRMALIDVPVQIVVGEEDSVIGADVLRRELIPHLTCTAAQLTMIPGAGHLVPLEAPSAVAPAIEQYVP